LQVMRNLRHNESAKLSNSRRAAEMTHKTTVKTQLK
jgi:hypothetical protein